MAKNRFIPEELPLSVREDPKLNAEVLVFDELKSQLDATEKDWTVVWNATYLLKQPDRDQPKEGEADFVLAHPKWGVIVVEVKGGKILFTGGQWKSRDRHGIEHDIDPFGQVGRNARNLEKKFNELPEWKSPRIGKLGRLVVYPDSPIPANARYPSEASADIVVEKGKLGNLVDAILAASKFWFGEQWSNSKATQAGPTLAALFASQITAEDFLGAELPLETRRFDRLTDDQFRVIQSARREPRVLVTGGAGSGKTLLARMRAKNLHAEGFRTLLLCSSEYLADFLRSITEQDKDLIVAAFGKLDELLFGQKVHAADEAEFGWKLLELFEDFPEKRFDAVVVDEGQDFQKQQWEFIEGLMREKKEDVFMIFADDNQQVYAHETFFPDRMFKLHLGDNVRTTRSIHDKLKGFYPADDPQRPLGPLGRSVKQVETGDDVLKTVREEVAALMEKDQIAVDDIVVLTPNDVSASRLCDLRFTHGRKLTPHPKPRVDVRLASIPDFKGLESAVVVLAEAECLPENEQERIRFCYTAFSRPRSHLVVIGDW